MKMPFILTLAGLAIAFALPALAQEQNSVDPEVRSADPELRQQIEAAIMKYEEAYKYDAAAVAALYTKNAIEVVAWEPAADVAVGQQAIEKRYASLFVSSPRKLSHNVVQVYMIGNEIRHVGFKSSLYHSEGLLCSDLYSRVSTTISPLIFTSRAENTGTFAIVQARETRQWIAASCEIGTMMV
jgi:hypothetical protein